MFLRAAPTNAAARIRDHVDGLIACFCCCDSQRRNPDVTVTATRPDPARPAPPGSAARDASRSCSAGSPSGASAVGDDRRAVTHFDAARPRQDARRRHVAPGAEDHGRHDGAGGARRDGERAGVKLAEPGFGRERAFREEHQRMAAGRRAQHAPRIRAALVAVEALDELRADAPQQQAGQRHIVHLALDDEPEARRQRRRHDHAVQVARVVGDDHALTRRAGSRRRSAAAACRRAARTTLLRCGRCRGAAPQGRQQDDEQQRGQRRRPGTATHGVHAVDQAQRERRSPPARVRARESGCDVMRGF